MSSPLTIIVVDDDAGMSQALERLLHAAGWRVLTFPSAEALLEAGAAPEASAFLIDIRLPGLSGFELSERLAKTGTRAAVIFMTAHDPSAAREEAQRRGAAGFFGKPFVGRQLLETLIEHARTPASTAT